MRNFDHDPERAGRRLRLLFNATVLSALGVAGLLATASIAPAHGHRSPSRAMLAVALSDPEPEPEAPVAPPEAPEPEPPPAAPTPIARREKARPIAAEPTTTADATPVAVAAPSAPPASAAPMRLGLSLSSMAPGSGGPAFAVGSPSGQVAASPTGGAKAPPNNAPPPAPRPARTAPTLLQAAAPEYPAQARAEGIEGVVVLALTIGPDGAVEEARVLRGLGHGLDEAALTASRNTRWTPATEGGRPIRVRRRFDVLFQLDS